MAGISLELDMRNHNFYAPCLFSSVLRVLLQLLNVELWALNTATHAPDNKLDRIMCEDWLNLVLHHAICVCNDGPTDDFSRVEEVNVRSTPVKICLRICRGKDDTRSSVLCTAAAEVILAASPLPSNIHLTLPGSQWQLVHFCITWKHCYLSPSDPLALPWGGRRASGR